MNLVKLAWGIDVCLLTSALLHFAQVLGAQELHTTEA